MGPQTPQDPRCKFIQFWIPEANLFSFLFLGLPGHHPYTLAYFGPGKLVHPECHREASTHTLPSHSQNIWKGKSYKFASPMVWWKGLAQMVLGPNHIKMHPGCNWIFSLAGKWPKHPGQQLYTNSVVSGILVQNDRDDESMLFEQRFAWHILGPWSARIGILCESEPRF